MRGATGRGQRLEHDASIVANAPIVVSALWAPVVLSRVRSPQVTVGTRQSLGAQ